MGSKKQPEAIENPVKVGGVFLLSKGLNVRNQNQLLKHINIELEKRNTKLQGVEISLPLPT